MPYLFLWDSVAHGLFPYFSDQPPQGGEGGDGGEGPGGLTDADFDSNWDEAIETFDGMELPDELLRGIYSYGFEKPSAIQQRAIKPTMLGKDLIAQAQSGTVRFLNAAHGLQFCICDCAQPSKGRMNYALITHLSSLNTHCD